MVNLELQHRNIPDEIITRAYDFGTSCLNCGYQKQDSAIAYSGGFYYLQCKTDKDIAKVLVLDFTGKIGCYPRSSDNVVSATTQLITGADITTSTIISPEYCYDLKNKAVSVKGFPNNVIYGSALNVDTETTHGDVYFGNIDVFSDFENESYITIHGPLQRNVFELSTNIPNWTTSYFSSSTSTSTFHTSYLPEVYTHGEKLIVTIEDEVRPIRVVGAAYISNILYVIAVAISNEPPIVPPKLYVLTYENSLWNILSSKDVSEVREPLEYLDNAFINSTLKITLADDKKSAIIVETPLSNLATYIYDFSKTGSSSGTAGGSSSASIGNTEVLTLVGSTSFYKDKYKINTNYKNTTTEAGNSSLVMGSAKIFAIKDPSCTPTLVITQDSTTGQLGLIYPTCVDCGSTGETKWAVSCGSLTPDGFWVNESSPCGCIGPVIATAEYGDVFTTKEIINIPAPPAPTVTYTPAYLAGTESSPTTEGDPFTAVSFANYSSVTYTESGCVRTYTAVGCGGNITASTRLAGGTHVIVSDVHTGAYACYSSYANCAGASCDNCVNFGSRVVSTFSATGTSYTLSYEYFIDSQHSYCTDILLGKNCDAVAESCPCGNGWTADEIITYSWSC